MKSFAGIFLAMSLAAALFAGPPVPRPEGDFHMVDPSGKTLDLHQYRGKVVLIQFLYTTCPHCQATARMLSSLQKELGPRGLQVLGVAFNGEAQSQPQVVPDFVKNNEVDFPVGTASQADVMKYLGISTGERFVVPQIVIIDRRGMIREQTEPVHSGELQDEANLRKLLDGFLAQKTTVSSRKR